MNEGVSSLSKRGVRERQTNQVAPIISSFKRSATPARDPIAIDVTHSKSRNWDMRIRVERLEDDTVRIEAPIPRGHSGESHRSFNDANGIQGVDGLIEIHIGRLKSILPVQNFHTGGMTQDFHRVQRVASNQIIRFADSKNVVAHGIRLEFKFTPGIRNDILLGRSHGKHYARKR